MAVEIQVTEGDGIFSSTLEHKAQDLKQRVNLKTFHFGLRFEEIELKSYIVPDHSNLVGTVNTRLLIGVSFLSSFHPLLSVLFLWNFLYPGSRQKS